MYLKEITNRVILILVGVCCALVIAELLLFVFNLPHFYKFHSHPPQFAFLNTDSDYVVYFNVPSTCIRFIYDGNPRGYFGKHNEVEHCTNSLGFRGKEFQREKPNNTIRIAFIGDSLTFGEGVRFEDTYSEKVSFLLGKHYSDLPVHFESYNFGVGGYNISDYLSILKNLVLTTNPDIVVLGYSMGDDEPPLFVKDKKSGKISRVPRGFEDSEWIREPFPPHRLLYKFRLSRLLWQIVDTRKRTKKICGYYQFLYDKKKSARLISRKVLPQIIELCHDRKIPCYVIFFPLLYELNDNHHFIHVYSLFRKIVEDEKVLFVDVFLLLKGLDARRLWVHPTDQHPNEIVHGIVAKALVEKIISNKNIE